MALKHPCHEHPLVPRSLSNNCEVLCGLCKLEIHGPTYCCHDCDYFLHKACAVIELPPEIWHPSHRHHQLTLSSDRGHNYSCSGCSGFTLHALTAIATLSPRENEELNEHTVEEHEHSQEVQEEKKGTIWHFAHKEHPLASFYVEIPLLTECKGCARRISGEVYGCRLCLFLLHASCALSPRVIDRHPFGTGLTLAQYDSNPVDAQVPDICRGCAGSIDNGFIYTLPGGPSASAFRLHMACAISTRFPPDHAFADSMDLKVHPSHPCPLVLFHIQEETYAPIRCRACELHISVELALGCPKCVWFLHKSCTEKLGEEIHHYLHPDHSLKLREPPTQRDKNYRCASCQESLSESDVYNMAFGCYRCDFYLHHNCAHQTLSVVEEGAAASVLHFAHDHPLQLHFIRYNDNSCDHVHCIACKQRVDGLAYCCLTCDSVWLHKSCAELPQQLEHEFHSHHLLVIPSKASSARYFRCTVCHEKSTGSGYCCAKCDFYLDAGCVSLKPTLKDLRHEHTLAYFKESANAHLPCNACGKTCKKDIYLCVPCDFRIHHDCLLPPTIMHGFHPYHPLILMDKFVPDPVQPDYPEDVYDLYDQYCDYCKELRDPDQGVYRCDECDFTVHIDCALPKAEVQVEAEVEETEEDPEEMETSKKEVGDLISSILANIMARTVVMGENIDGARKSLEASMRKLEDLEEERVRELESMRSS